MDASERFTGTVELLMGLNVSAMAAWLEAIPLAEWPQQTCAPGALKPAMINDPRWRGFDIYRGPLEEHVLDRIGGVAATPMLSVVMPGERIEAHADLQLPSWRCRVHVPILTNPGAVVIFGDESYYLERGAAYLFNTEALHAVRNDGETPRIHYMFDVMAAG